MNTNDISLFIGKYSIFVAIAIVVGVLAYQIMKIYLENKKKITKTLEKFKK
jgi:hypothetical protein